MVDALWTSSAGFNETNVQDLFNKINGASGTTFAQIKSLANSKMTASQIRAKTYGKTSSQDIEVVLGGLEWEVVYLSTDTDGNAILTLWLDNNQQPGWTGKSQTEGAFYGFYDGGLYSDWSGDWYTTTTSQGTAAFYPSAMYGTSYIRAVTLNNGGQYATSNSALTSASQNPSSVFAPFTMSSSGLYEYIVTPAKVSWQENQSAKTSASMSYKYPNDEWNPSTEKGKYYSDAYNYVEHNGYNTWKDDKIWLPSMAETGYNDSHLGLWGVSIDQRKNFDGSTPSISGQKVGGSNTQNTSSLYTYSWLRSGVYNGAAYAYYLLPSGSGYSNSSVSGSGAVRPALHLNLTRVMSEFDWNAIASGKDFANSGHAGTVDDPYLIESAEDLAQLSKDAAGGNNYTDKVFQQTVDISLAGHEWVPIKSFQGNYDGQNHVISGMTIVKSTEASIGLFGSMSYSPSQRLGPEIRNVKLSKATIKTTSSSSAGGIVGNAASSYGSLKITNCSADNAQINTRSGNVGGIAGYSYRCYIKQCTFKGNISGSASYVGGIIGSTDSSTGVQLNDCSAYADIYSDNSGGRVGGIAGAIGTTQIGGCIFSGSLYGENYVGGLVGYNHYGNSNSIGNCAVFGSVICKDASKAGGLSGYYNPPNYQTSMDRLSNCSVNIQSNAAIALFEGNTDYCGKACYSKVNNRKGISASSDGFDAYTIVKNMNDGLPMQNSLFSIAIGGQTSEYVYNYLVELGF